MSAYVISDVEIVDHALIGEYLILAQASIARYGGRYLASTARGARAVPSTTAMRRASR